jgi:CBS domain-containing protein
MDTKIASEIMTKTVVTISPDATLREAAELLAFRRVSGAPVLDADGTVVGIVTESDLMNEAKKRAALPHTAPFGLFIAPEAALQRIFHDGASLLVDEIMTKDVLTVTGDTPVRLVADTMTKKRINRLPVVDSHGKLVGIITREDVLRALFDLPKVH